MKPNARRPAAAAALYAALLAGAAFAQPAENADKTLSPYFLVKSDEPAADQLPLLSTRADVNIAGVIADVRVTQVYKNAGKTPIEAIYVFPGSTRAAVYGMKMTIAERTIVADIQERQKARETYERAKAEGKSASLLEQQRPNVFQMNVANIMPGDTIQVELKYTELLVPTEGLYEFMYPTVVGPRYSNKAADQAPDTDKWIASPYLHAGEAPPYTFDIRVGLNTGVPLQDIACSSHKVSVSYRNPSAAEIALDASEKAGGNRDYILKYRLTGGQVESGLLLYRGADENFFLLMVQPPKRVPVETIPPREYIFIVDVSGSMHGFPLDVSKKLLGDLISNLRPTDTFNVLLFSGGSSVMAESSLPATPENVQRAVAVIEQQRGGGGTELLPALKSALALPKTEGASRTVVIATDGYVGVEVEAFELIRASLDQANMFAFGIGSSVNRFLIEGMARAGAGEPFIVTKPEEAPAIASRFRQYIQTPVLTGVQCDFGGFDAYDVQPSSIPDVLAERPVILFGKWRGATVGTIAVKGLAAGRAYEAALNVAQSAASEANIALRYLWARDRIAMLADYNAVAGDDKRVREITDLGLKYSLLTAYTSFVAVDTVVRNVDGKMVTVKQPLPLPQGVSDLAVGDGNFAVAGTMPMPAPGMARGFLGGRAALKSAVPMREAVSADRAKKEQDQPVPTPAAGECVVDAYCANFTVPEGRYALSHLTRLGFGDVEAFQRTQGLSADGVVGPRTWAALLAALQQQGLDASIARNKTLQVNIRRAAEGKLTVELVNASADKIAIPARGSLVKQEAGQTVLVLSLTCTPSDGSKPAVSVPVRFALPAELAPGAKIEATVDYTPDPSWTAGARVELEFIFTDGRRTIEVQGALRLGGE